MHGKNRNKNRKPDKFKAIYLDELMFWSMEKHKNDWRSLCVRVRARTPVVEMWKHTHTQNLIFTPSIALHCSLLIVLMAQSRYTLDKYSFDSIPCNRGRVCAFEAEVMSIDFWLVILDILWFVFSTPPKWGGAWKIPRMQLYLLPLLDERLITIQPNRCTCTFNTLTHTLTWTDSKALA